MPARAPLKDRDQRVGAPRPDQARIEFHPLALPAVERLVDLIDRK
jgi:hypothetical protein